MLRNVSHTYRHDLESFFYVLLWICGRRVWDRGFRCRSNDRPTESILTMWYSGSFKEIARIKQGDMHIDGFEDILEEFPPVFDSVKPLCRKIRGILFPLLKNGGLYTGTPPNSETLYDPIIKVFDDAIAGIAITEGSSG